MTHKTQSQKPIYNTGLLAETVAKMELLAKRQMKIVSSNNKTRTIAIEKAWVTTGGGRHELKTTKKSIEQWELYKHDALEAMINEDTNTINNVCLECGWPELTQRVSGVDFEILSKCSSRLKRLHMKFVAGGNPSILNTSEGMSITMAWPEGAQSTPPVSVRVGGDLDKLLANSGIPSKAFGMAYRNFRNDQISKGQTVNVKEYLLKNGVEEREIEKLIKSLTRGRDRSAGVKDENFVVAIWMEAINETETRLRCAALEGAAERELTLNCAYFDRPSSKRGEEWTGSVGREENGIHERFVEERYSPIIRIKASPTLISMLGGSETSISVAKKRSELSLRAKHEEMIRAERERIVIEEEKAKRALVGTKALTTAQAMALLSIQKGSAWARSWHTPLQIWSELMKGVLPDNSETYKTAMGTTEGESDTGTLRGALGRMTQNGFWEVTSEKGYNQYRVTEDYLKDEEKWLAGVLSKSVGGSATVFERQKKTLMK